MNAQEVLTYYWGHPQFRPNQESIIESVLDGIDTLALLPTGGGKSICFQVPALMTEGCTLVVSPLIALMQDQVRNLEDKGISSLCITSNMSWREMQWEYDNMVNGKYKLVYCSPERLLSKRFNEALKHLDLDYLAVDEAHCIAQWGHDFRPSYLEIASIKPKKATIALTATATTQVQKEIVESLQFRGNHKVFRNSHRRENLSYNVVEAEDKSYQLDYWLNKHRGSGLVYVSSRKKTKDVAQHLHHLGYSADYYHAGLAKETKNQKQEWWTRSKEGIMVCTNAFGMGIDKPDVRCVVHYEPPQSLEAYYQEAGRAGRDQEPAHVYLLHQPSDQKRLKDGVDQNFPDLNLLSRLYDALMNYLNVAVGALPEEPLPFDLSEFSNRFDFEVLTSYNGIKRLENQKLMKWMDKEYVSSKIHVEMGAEQLYDFYLKQPRFERIIKTILRSYGGVYSHFVDLSESLIAKRLKIPVASLVKALTDLHTQGVIHYVKGSHESRLLLLEPRTVKAVLNRKKHEQEKHRLETKIDSVVQYLKSENTCRENELLNYFGESPKTECGKCDYCRKNNKLSFSVDKKLIKDIRLELKIDRGMHDVVKRLNDYPQIKVIDHLRFLIDDGQIKQLNNDKLSWDER